MCLGNINGNDALWRVAWRRASQVGLPECFFVHSSCHRATPPVCVHNYLGHKKVYAVDRIGKQMPSPKIRVSIHRTAMNPWYKKDHANFPDSD